MLSLVVRVIAAKNPRQALPLSRETWGRSQPPRSCLSARRSSSLLPLLFCRLCRRDQTRPDRTPGDYFVCLGWRLAGWLAGQPMDRRGAAKKATPCEVGIIGHIGHIGVGHAHLLFPVLGAMADFAMADFAIYDVMAAGPALGRLGSRPITESEGRARSSCPEAKIIADFFLLLSTASVLVRKAREEGEITFPLFVSRRPGAWLLGAMWRVSDQPRARLILAPVDRGG